MSRMVEIWEKEYTYSKINLIESHRCRKLLEYYEVNDSIRQKATKYKETSMSELQDQRGSRRARRLSQYQQVVPDSRNAVREKY